MKKTVLTVMLVLTIVSGLFASGSTEVTRAWFEADKLADAAVKYLPSQRSATLEIEGGNTYQAEASYDVRNADLLFRKVSGDSEVFDLLDTLSDGFILTPFEDDAVDVDKKYMRSEELDGRTCLVYEADTAVFESIFFYGKSQGGELIGYDDGDTDGSVKITLWLDAATGEIVREVIRYEGLSFLPYLALTQDVRFGSENGLIVPTEVVTTGHFRRSAAKSFSLYEDVNFTITEERSGYTKMESYTHE